MSVATALMRETLRDVAPDVWIISLGPLPALIEGSMTEELLLARLSAVVAGLAVVLACAGVYAVVGFSANTRIPEFGIRIALGARWSHVVAVALRGAIVASVAGVCVGLGIFWFASRLLAANLYGVSALDPITLMSALAGVLGVAFLAALFPALRGARVDPIVALREK
jgi:ABC-type antimicrobial peptide transport system permease subunit